MIGKATISPDEVRKAFEILGAVLAGAMEANPARDSEPTSLTAAQAASVINCSRSHVYTLFRAGRLSGYSIGVRGIRIHRDSAEKFRRNKLFLENKEV